MYDKGKSKLCCNNCKLVLMLLERSCKTEQKALTRFEQCSHASLCSNIRLYRLNLVSCSFFEEQYNFVRVDIQLSVKNSSGEMSVL